MEGETLAEKPLVSIALLVKNGMPGLGGVLGALRGQDYDVRVEIVAVDSGSTDGSVEALEAAGARVHRIRPEDFQFGSTRQLCFGLTRGRVIVTLSQDAVPVGRDFLSVMVDPILKGETDVVLGKDMPKPGRFFYWDRFGFFATSVHDHWPRVLQGFSCTCLAISRGAWEQTGFGDVPMSEDKYLGVRVAEAGLRYRFAERPTVDHFHSYTVRGLAKRCFNEGFGGRYSDGRYPFGKMCRSLLRFQKYRWVVSGLLHGQIKTPAEVMFAVVRPVMLWVGFTFGRRYWR